MECEKADCVVAAHVTSSTTRATNKIGKSERDVLWFV